MKTILIILIGAIAAIVLVDQARPTLVTHNHPAVLVGGLGLPDDYVEGLCRIGICDPRNPRMPPIFP